MNRVLRWLKGEFGDFAIAVSLAAFLCIVLPVQTYMANASLFVFTPGRLALELTILFVVLAAALWMRTWLHWVALAFLVLVLASLFDVRREQAPASTQTTDGGFSSGFEWQRDIIENFRYSPKRLPVKGMQKHGWAALLLRSKEVPYLSLFDMVVFRLSPYCAKAPFLYSKIRHDPMMGCDESNFWYEHVMFPILGRAPLSGSPTTLGIFHSRGAHPPLLFDPNGKAYPRPRVDPGMIGDHIVGPDGTIRKGGMR